MNDPQPPKLSQSLETLINTGLFRQLSDEKQNGIIMNMIKDHDEYVKKITEFYEGLKP